MTICELLITSEELPVLRDVVIEAYQALKQHAKTVANPSDNLTRRLASLEGLKVSLSNKCLKTR